MGKTTSAITGNFTCHLQIYKLSEDFKGRICATDVWPEGFEKDLTYSESQLVWSIFMSSLFFGIVTVMVLTERLPLFVLVIYVTISILTYFVYEKDKFAAQVGARRTPESVLHYLSVIGGWPGATIAQSYLRHKSRKESFRYTFWITVIINITILGIVFIPSVNHKIYIFLDFLDELAK